MAVGFGNIPTGQTYYMVPGYVGLNQNFEALSAFSGTILSLYAKTAVAPGIGNTYVFTVYVGPPISMIATDITCTIAGSATTCSDISHTASISAGQAWSLQIVTSASAAGTLQSTASVGTRY